MTLIMMAQMTVVSYTIADLDYYAFGVIAFNISALWLHIVFLSSIEVFLQCKRCIQEPSIVVQTISSNLQRSKAFHVNHHQQHQTEKMIQKQPHKKRFDCTILADPSDPDLDRAQYLMVRR